MNSTVNVNSRVVNCTLSSVHWLTVTALRHLRLIRDEALKRVFIVIININSTDKLSAECIQGNCFLLSKHL